MALVLTLPLPHPRANNLEKSLVSVNPLETCIFIPPTFKTGPRQLCSTFGSATFNIVLSSRVLNKGVRLPQAASILYATLRCWQSFKMCLGISWPAQTTLFESPRGKMKSALPHWNATGALTTLSLWRGIDVPSNVLAVAIEITKPPGTSNRPSMFFGQINFYFLQKNVKLNQRDFIWSFMNMNHCFMGMGNSKRTRAYTWIIFKFAKRLHEHQTTSFFICLRSLIDDLRNNYEQNYDKDSCRLEKHFLEKIDNLSVWKNMSDAGAANSPVE